MSESIGDALRALSVLCEAAERLSQGHEVHTAPLLASYASLRPAGHAAAGAHSLDLEFLGAVRGMGEELWGARVLELQRSVVRATPFLAPRGDDAVTLLVPPGLEGPGDALALMLGVATESAKLQRLAAEGAEGPLLPKVAAALGCPPLEVVDRMECVGDRDTAEALLQRLYVAGPNRSVRSPMGAAAGTAPVEAAFRGRSDRGGPLFVVAGATERLHDLVSPWVRRLQSPLAKLAGTRHSDDLYALLPNLFAEDPQLHDERINVEHDEGALISIGDALLIRFEHLDTTLVDERARAVVT
ncbi:MAG: hypothetical protein ACO3JL_14110, partial [Myxococcota bacterium]